MTRVIHIIKTSGIAGAERHLLVLLPELARRGIDPELVVLTVPGGEAFVRAASGSGIHVTEVPAGSDVSPVMVRRLKEILQRRAPDIVHTHLIHADLHGQIAATLTRVPRISSVHGAHGFYRRQPFRSAAWIAGHLATRTVAVSHHVARMLDDAKIARPERVRVVHYGLDVEQWSGSSEKGAEFRKNLGLSRDETAVGIAARLIPGKGHDVLIRAMGAAAARGSRLRLLIAGTGAIRSEVEALVESEGITATVSLLGFVRHMDAFMSACDMVAFPTQPALGEGFGLAALEAMAAGKAVVASRVASLPELVVHERTGLLVSPGDVGGLADALMKLANEPHLRSRMGEAGRERARQSFSLDAMIDTTMDVYDEVLAASR